MRSLSSGLALLLLSTSQAVAQNSGTFDILSFNVAGLPAILNSNGVPGNKRDNTARIGQLLTQYNTSLIHLQEDFAYHDTLYENAQAHPYRTETSGNVPFGDGMNTLSNFAFEGFERVKWNRCSSITAADCFAPKGFTYMRVKVAEGVSIDAYNIHADAGATLLDKRAREDNLRQLSNFIKTRSGTNAVLIFGDLNSYYTRSGDVPQIFRTDNGMKDVWIELIRNGAEPADNDASVPNCGVPAANLNCEILDKVFYRGSPTLALQAISFKYASDVYKQESGEIISDHNPVYVEFAWSRA
ncbi:hypothetical protein M011DRAFT_438022 [Sporormia fimetaria CBS 119925]|uniref:Inositol polyphosphate-related phosphatase domain-containing protein n=1 Tax=Sporormia fimetaria CBS 119925 TaxID=1340428 RepID=A0A6A6VKS6_9PLEO|nr:hypothetical protein M011DRAFT_438022 [Sporormia fimetaria CBS 119925]